MFSKKSRNIINVISFISLFGIAVATAAMIIVLSAFNGIEQTVVGLYDDFDQDVTIKMNGSKTMNSSFFPLSKLESVNDIVAITPVIEEVIILKHHDKWVNAKVYGVDTVFLSMAKMKEKVMDSMEAKIYSNERPLAMLGAGVFDKLGVYLSLDDMGYDQVSLFAPYREAKSNRSKDAFSTMSIGVAGRFNYNKDVNDRYVVLPISTAAELLKYNQDVSYFAIKFSEGVDLDKKKDELMQLLGEEFDVTTRYQKNELIYKTSRVEKLISVAVLCFIFLLATFNMIASLSMLFLEKEKDILTLKSMGASKHFVFNIFFKEGLLINFLGMIIGLLIGTVVCWVQIKFGILKVQNGMEEVIPVVLKSSDYVLIVALISALGALSCYIPVKVLMNRSKVYS